jgi:hypothetical protein
MDENGFVLDSSAEELMIHLSAEFETIEGDEETE